MEPGAELSAKEASPTWTGRQLAIIAQQKLFDSERRPLEKAPWTFHYRFKCSPECPEHTFTVLDWEIFALYRSQAKKKSPEEAVRDVLDKYNVEYSAERRNVHLFVGTTIDRQTQFSIIGVYYPPRECGSPVVPLSLFDAQG